MTATAKANGTAVTVDAFPLDRFRDAARELRRPFTPAAVRFKVQANLGPKDAPTGGLVVCYIDARLVVERLNLIVPDRWSDSYEPFGSGLMWCHLTVDGITRSDVGEGQGKALVSDALKRAAVKFGVGVSLYATPSMFVKVADGHAKVINTSKGKAVALTPNGDTYVRGLYSAWLDTKGIQAFGGPLDHGDTLGAQGDAEAGDRPAEAHEEPPSEPEPPLPMVPAAMVAELQAARNAADVDESWLRLQLVALGVQDVPQHITQAVVKRLTFSQASALLDVLNETIAAKAAKP